MCSQNESHYEKPERRFLNRFHGSLGRGPLKREREIVTPGRAKGTTTTIIRGRRESPEMSPRAEEQGARSPQIRLYTRFPLKGALLCRLVKGTTIKGHQEMPRNRKKLGGGGSGVSSRCQPEKVMCGFQKHTYPVWWWCKCCQAVLWARQAITWQRPHQGPVR